MQRRNMSFALSQAWVLIPAQLPLWTQYLSSYFTLLSLNCPIWKIKLQSLKYYDTRHLKDGTLCGCANALSLHNAHVDSPSGMDLLLQLQRVLLKMALSVHSFWRKKKTVLPNIALPFITGQFHTLPNSMFFPSPSINVNPKVFLIKVLNAELQLKLQFLENSTRVDALLILQLLSINLPSFL